MYLLRRQAIKPNKLRASKRARACTWGYNINNHQETHPSRGVVSVTFHCLCACNQSHQHQLGGTFSFAPIHVKHQEQDHTRGPGISVPKKRVRSSFDALQPCESCPSSIIKIHEKSMDQRNEITRGAFPPTRILLLLHLRLLLFLRTLGILCNVPTSAAKPTLTSAMQNLASSEHSLMSHAHAKSTAPPTHAPWIAAMTGWGHRSTAEKDSCVFVSQFR